MAGVGDGDWNGVGVMGIGDWDWNRDKIEGGLRIGGLEWVRGMEWAGE